MATNVITASFAEGCTATKTAALWQWDYGQVLQITGLELPQSFEAHFTNTPGGGHAKVQIGLDGQVTIPDRYFESGQPIYCYIYLHSGTTDGETEYAITIPVKPRAVPLGEAVTHEEQGVIQQYMAALQAGVTAAETSAEESAASATESANSATASAESATEAAQSAQTATAQAQAAETAKTAAQAAQTGAEQAKADTEALLSTKGDALAYDAAAAELSLKSGDDTLSTVGVGLKWVKDADGTGATSLQATVENDVSGNTATGQYSHAEGLTNTASGTASHAEGGQNTASGIAAHVEGTQNTASGSFSHAEGTKNTASGIASHAEGRNSKASAQAAHAEGNYTEASGGSSHAEGQFSYASGVCSHAEGENSFARARSNHVEGIGNEADASQIALHMGGVYGVTSTATGKTISVQDKKSDGTYDGTPVSRVLGQYAEIIGNGNSDTDRSNARTLDWNGNEVISGKLTMGAGPTIPMDAATKGYTDTLLSTKGDALAYDAETGALELKSGDTVLSSVIIEAGGNLTLGYDPTTGRLSLLKDGTEVSYVILSGLPVTITRDGDTLRVNNVPAVTSIVQTDGTLALT